jgi:ATP-dependent Lon protease
LNKLPVLLLKSFVIFPNQEVKLELNNDISKKVVNLSYKEYNKKVLVLCPIDQKEENPDVSDLPKIGVEATIVSRIMLPNLNVRVTLKGIRRVKAENFYNNENLKYILECDTNEVILPLFAKEEEQALRRKLYSLLEEYVNLSPELSNDILAQAKNTNNFYRFTDLIATFLDLSIEQKLFYMQEINPLYRAHKLIEDLNLELEVIRLDETIEDKLQTSLEDSQKEFILKEKLNQIKELLGEDEESDTEEFIRKAKDLDLEEKTLKHILHEIDKYSKTLSTSPEVAILRNYIDTFLSLPWNNYGKKETNLNNILKVLNKSHYGLIDVKERIIEYIAAKKRNPNLKSPIICLVGPPGV